MAVRCGGSESSSRWLGSFELGPNHQNQGIHVGDARELASDIPDESVDLIFTDPLYDKIEDYRWLAKTAARILKPNSPCLAWCSKMQLSNCEAVMKESLTHQTVLFYTVMAKSARPAFQIGIISWTTPCLVFAKGVYKCQPFLPDTFIASAAPQTRFKWNKNTPVHERWMRAFCDPEAIVVDFFCGMGTVPAAAKVLGRRWLAFEINGIRANLARDRVRETQVPWFEAEAEQMELGL